MSNTVVVVDDSLVDTSTGTAVRQVVYQPPQAWGTNARCGDCGVNNEAAMNLLQNTARAGTWTTAGFDRNYTTLSATLDFQGTSAAVYCIFFRRALDAAATGSATLTFFINGTVHSSRPVGPQNYTFNSNNFTPRMQAFQVSNLDPNFLHSLRMEWTHGGVTRTAVTVALDSIEFTTTSTSTGTPQTDSTDRPSHSTKIVVGVLIPVVVLLAVALAIVLWRKRRKQQETDTQNHPFSAVVVPGHRGPERLYQVEPFILGSNPGGEPPLSMVQTENTSIAPPISSTDAQPPSYYESHASPWSGYDSVQTRQSPKVARR